jgi:hypothetical protein
MKHQFTVQLYLNKKLMIFLRYWPILEDAAFSTGDRVWRMPLWKFYGDQMKSESYL